MRDKKKLQHLNINYQFSLRVITYMRFDYRVGIVLMVLGEIGNFSAYAFAPASLVAPLGTTTVIGKY